LLYLVSALGEKRVSKTFLDKLLFVLRKETRVGDWVRFYNFFPYNYGPFSNNFYYDLSDLRSRGLLHEFELSDEAKQLAGGLTQKEKAAVEETAARFENEKQVVDYVYANYPGYTVKSRLRESKAVEQEGFATVGYEGHDVDSFLDLLVQNGVQVVADVRANPFSMNFVFTKAKISSYLEKVGIEYRHFPELGIPGEYRKQMNSMQLLEFYEKTLLPRQKQKFGELIELGKNKKTVLLCLEHDEKQCHRGVLAKQIEAQTGRRPEAL